MGWPSMNRNICQKQIASKFKAERIAGVEVAVANRLLMNVSVVGPHHVRLTNLQV